MNRMWKEVWAGRLDVEKAETVDYNNEVDRITKNILWSAICKHQPITLQEASEQAKKELKKKWIGN